MSSDTYIWESGTNNNGNGTANNQYHISDTSERLTIQRGTGNVGIGTNAPVDKLQVEGTIQTNKIKINTADGLEFSDGTIKLSNNLDNDTWIKSVDNINRFYFTTNDNTVITTNTELLFGTNNGSSYRMTIKDYGFVDITTSGGFSGSISNRPYWGYFDSAINVDSSSFNFPTSLRTNEAILTQSYFITNSDSRIKKDIQDLEDQECLNKLLALQPKKYKYIDTYARGENITYGFIAQEVETVLPEAVKTMQQYPPNIYCNYNITDNNVRLTDNSKYTPVLNHKLEIHDGARNIYHFNIIEITDNLNFKINSEKNTVLNGEYFIYGYLIDDFKSLSKDHFHAITVASVQELHRKIEQQQQQINQLIEILNRNNIS